MDREMTRRRFGEAVVVGGLSASGDKAMQAGGDGRQHDARRRLTALPSWRDGGTKSQILDFLSATTTTGSHDFVPMPGRAAVFDNDGTLWTEQPVMPEVVFALFRLREMAPQHPEWKTEEPFKSVLEGDKAALARGGVATLVKLAVATQAGTTIDRFRDIVAEWLRQSRHPRFGRPFSDLVYQPMLEVLSLFVESGFKCFVVSAGGVEFLRAWTEGSYGLPADRVIGSTLDLDYVFRDGQADLLQMARVASLSDGSNKAAAIANVVGQRPLAAFGNSDGDYEMLQYVTTGAGRRLGMLVHHDDSEREYAYDRSATFGRLDRCLQDAAQIGWVVASMRKDWDRIYRF